MGMFSLSVMLSRTRGLFRSCFLKGEFPAAGQPDYIKGACSDTDAAACTEFLLDVEDYRFSVPDLVDLLIRYRINRIQFDCINGTCDYAIPAARAEVDVYVECKCHRVTFQIRDILPSAGRTPAELAFFVHSARVTREMFRCVPGLPGNPEQQGRHKR